MATAGATPTTAKPLKLPIGPAITASIGAFQSATGTEFVGCVCASICLTFFLALTGVLICLPLKTLTVLLRSNQGYGTGDLVLQPFWEWCINDWGFITASAAFPGVMSLAFYFIGAVPFCLLDWLDLKIFRRYKLRGETRPASTWGDWYKTLQYTANLIVLYILPGVAWQIFTKGPWMYSGPSVCFHSCNGKELLPLTAPPLLEFAAHVVLSLVVFDTLYFVWHKSHHEERRLYKHIHTVHHQYHAPFVFVTQYAHPCEIFAVSIFSMAVPIFMGAHPLSQWVWMIISVQISLEAHAGYELPISVDKFLPFLGLSGAIHHDLHHQWPRTNFQPFLTWADHLFQTDYRFSAEALRATAKLKEGKSEQKEAAPSHALSSAATAGKAAKAD